MPAHSRWLLWVAAFAVGSFTGRASAEPSHEATRPRVSVEMANCGDVSPAEVRRIAALELHLPVEASSADITSKLTTVLIECGNETTLTLVDAVTHKKVIRGLALDRVAPIARPRLLALSVVELLSASWAELELLPPEVEAPAASPTVRARAIEVVQRKRTPRATTVATVFGTARTFGAQWGALGGGVQVAVDLGTRAALVPGVQANVTLEHAAYQASLGTISIDIASAGLSAYLAWRLGPLTIHPGVGFQGGRVAQAGKPFDPVQTDGRSGSGWYASPLVSLGASVSLSKSWLIQCTPEAGYVVLPVGIYVAHERTVAVEGPWFGASLGVGLAL